MMNEYANLFLDKISLDKIFQNLTIILDFK
jgi:hypothetical protein